MSTKTKQAIEKIKKEYPTAYKHIYSDGYFDCYQDQKKYTEYLRGQGPKPRWMR